jgi:hypothetical protein
LSTDWTTLSILIFTGHFLLQLPQRLHLFELLISNWFEYAAKVSWLEKLSASEAQAHSIIP